MTYAAEVLADAPLLYWRLGEASGATEGFDSTAHGNHYVYAEPTAGGPGAPPNTSRPTAGVPGLLGGDANTAASFSGDSTNVVGGDTFVVPAGIHDNFTMECIVKVTDPRPHNPGDLIEGVIFDIDDGYGSPFLLAYQIADDGSNPGWSDGFDEGDIFLKFNYSDQYGAHHSTNGYVLNLQQTYHVVATFEHISPTASECRLYINGLLVDTVPGSVGNPTHPNQSAGLNFPGTVAVGNYVGTGFNSWIYPMDGVVDEVAFWDGKTLSSTRVAAHFAASGITSAITPHPAAVQVLATVKTPGGTVAGSSANPAPSRVSASINVPLPGRAGGAAGGQSVRSVVTIGAPIVFQPYDTWRPRINPDHSAVLVCRTNPGEHDTVLTHNTLWSFDTEGFDGAISPGHVRMVKSIPSTYSWTSYGHPEWNSDGSQVVIYVETPTTYQIVLLDGIAFTTGSTLYTATKPDSALDPSFMPDGSVVFVEQTGGTYHISKVTQAVSPVKTQLINSLNLLSDPVVSPDGTKILYGERTQPVSAGHAYGQWRLNTIPLLGGVATTVFDWTNASLHATWQNNTTILFQAMRYGTDSVFQVARVKVDGSGLSVFGPGEYPQAVKI